MSELYIPENYKPLLSVKETEAAIRRALADTCAQVLADAGVYKQTEAGRAGLIRFMEKAGFQRA